MFVLYGVFDSLQCSAASVHNLYFLLGPWVIGTLCLEYMHVFESSLLYIHYVRNVQPHIVYSCRAGFGAKS